METLLAIYLAGVLGFGGVGVYACGNASVRAITVGECRTIAVAGAVIWPVVAVGVAVEKIND